MPSYVRGSCPIATILAGLLGGCTTVPLAPAGSNGWQALGEDSDFGPQITPLKVLEDSRCPKHTNCIRPGTVKVLTRITLYNGDWVRDEVLAIGQRVEVSDGSAALSGVFPERSSGKVIAPGEYRFAYRFDGGL